MHGCSRALTGDPLEMSAALQEESPLISSSIAPAQPSKSTPLVGLTSCKSVMAVSVSLLKHATTTSASSTLRQSNK